MEVVREKLGCTNDISEIYSPKRIATMAREYGLRGGFSLDFSTPDKDGYVWDFSRPECRDRAWKKLVTERPYLLIGSPQCTAFSILQIFRVLSQEQTKRSMR